MTDDDRARMTGIDHVGLVVDDQPTAGKSVAPCEWSAEPAPVVR